MVVLPLDIQEVDQSTNTENGIYKVVASGTASRDPDFDTVDELAGQMNIVKEGSQNADKFFLCTTDNSGSVGRASGEHFHQQ